VDSDVKGTVVVVAVVAVVVAVVAVVAKVWFQVIESEREPVWGLNSRDQQLNYYYCTTTSLPINLNMLHRRIKITSVANFFLLRC
jgi:hypothetical protein